ncbi:MAG: hypothetical protein AB3P07_05595 [Wolbachia pipientis]
MRSLIEIALDAGIQPFCNLIENVVPPFYASLLVSNMDPSVWALG